MNVSALLAHEIHAVHIRWLVPNVPLLPQHPIQEPRDITVTCSQLPGAVTASPVFLVFVPGQL